MNKSEDISLLAAAFVKAQTMVESAKKDSINPFFNSKYADLAAVWDAVRAALEENSLAVSQLADAGPDGSPALTTMLIHASGQWISSVYPLSVQKADAQSYGSAISYARRYALAALMGVLSEDDDGEGATRPTKPQADKHPSAPVYAPVKPEIVIMSDSKRDAAKAWALGEIPRIRTMDKAALDKFCERFRKARIDLAVLDTKASVELEKALADRLEALFA